MDVQTDILLEPGKAYQEVYRQAFLNHAKEQFDELVQKSAVNQEENRKSAIDYRQKDEESKAADKKLGLWRGLRTFTVIAAIGCALGSFAYWYTQNNTAVGIPLALASVVLFVLIFSVLRMKVNQAKAYAEERSAAAKKQYEICMTQVTPLLNLFDSGMTAELVQKTVPTMVLDPNYDNARCDYLHGKYGFPIEDGKDYSTVQLLSGEIVGNPFLVERRRYHWMGVQTYHGTLTIHWTTTERDSNGNWVTHHHTQTLHASVTKPKPFYRFTTRLVYGNEAAPDLTFSHEPSHAEQYSDSKLKSVVRSGAKKLHKKAQKEVGSGFTEMGNEEFDVLFGATDRDNEVQFRLLYTPLAQKNTLELMKGASPYGDDFTLLKNHCLNTVISEHAENWDLDTSSTQYRSYEIALIRERFMNYNSEYFQHLYFELAPLLAIPLYQQHKPQEYIYKDVYPRNFTNRTAEMLANTLGQESFRHPGSATESILKTELSKKENGVDHLSITAYSFKGVHRVDYIPVLGGDGNIHDVPVPWILYIPVSQRTEMDVCALDMDDPTYRTSDYGKSGATHAFCSRLYATLGTITERMDDDPDAKDEGDDSLTIDETDGG